MTERVQKRLGSSRQRGFWLRCFLGVIGLGLSSSVLSLQMAHAQGIVDCVYPGRVSVSRVRGRVFDPFGAALPGVAIKLADEQSLTLETTADGWGRFHFSASPGKYSFEATLPMFQTSRAQLIVGEDLIGLVRHSELYVILGLSGSECAWATTSQKEFKQIVSSNKKRSEEPVQNNATQK